MAHVKILSVLEKVGPVAGFNYRVKETNEEKLISSKVIDKVFFYSDEPSESKPQQCYVVKLCTSFEHY